MAIPATYDEFLDFAKDAARVIAPDAEIKTQKVDTLQGESETPGGGNERISFRP